MANDSMAIGQKTEGNPTDWSSTPGNGGLTERGKNAVVSSLDAAGPDSGLGEAAHEYADKISDAVTQAKDYVGDVASNVSGKIKELANSDLSGLAVKARDFARENPGQAILVSAAAGMLLGLIIRGRR